MNKQQALDRLSALENEAKELRKIIEAPESLLTKPAPGATATVVTYALYGHFHCSPITIADSVEYGGNVFQTKELADKYAEAFETFLLLRHQPGTVPATRRNNGSDSAWFIDPNAAGKVHVKRWNGFGSCCSRLSPCFSTEESAAAALNAIGADRILRMFKTFHHVED